METIGKKWPRRAKSSDYQAMCDYCGTMFRASQLVRKPGGALACFGPGTLNDAKGKDEYELSRGNAEGARSAGRRAVGKRPIGGNFDDDI